LYDKLGLGGESGATGTHLAYLQYGLDMAVDMSSVLSLPPWLGSLTLKGFVYYT
jgi:hypothetical protein